MPPPPSWARWRPATAPAAASTSTSRCWTSPWPCWPIGRRLPQCRQRAAAPGQYPSQRGALWDFPTADGNMLLAIGNDGQFARFCEAAEVDWAQDERFATNAGRVTHRKTLIPMMMEVTRGRPTAQWITLLEAKTVPCGPINDIAQAYDDPQVRHRGLRIEQALPGARPPASDGIARWSAPPARCACPTRRRRCAMRRRRWASIPRKCCGTACRSARSSSRRCAPRASCNAPSRGSGGSGRHRGVPADAGGRAQWLIIQGREPACLAPSARPPASPARSSRSPVRAARFPWARWRCAR